MINRAMEMLENMEQSTIWFIYECLLATYTTVSTVMILFAHISAGDTFLDKFDWPEYFSILSKVCIPYALTLVIRLVAAINYIIFGNEG